MEGEQRVAGSCVFCGYQSVSAVQLKMISGVEMGERSDKVLKHDPDQP